MRLVLVGTGHVLDLAAAVRGIIHEERPSIVALELDADRFRGLLQRQTGAPQPDPKNVGRVYRYLAKFQESIGESFGVQPGTEMLVGAQAAQEVGASIELIDVNAQAAVQGALRAMTMREKLRLVLGSLGALLPSRRKGQVEAELQRYQDDPDGYLAELGRQFPTIRRALIDDRDDHMSRRLRELATTHPEATIVAVLGDGHVGGIMRRLDDLHPIVHRLKDLRGRRGIPPPPIDWRQPDARTVGFSFDSQSLEGSLDRGPR